MYDIFQQIISHVWVTNDSMQQYIVYGCIVLTIILATVFIDLVYRVFRHFWRH